MHERFSFLKRDDKLELIRVRYLRFDSIRTESSLAKSNRLTGNRLAVGNNRGYEIAAIRVDSHDSLRIAPAKSNRLTGSRLELGDNWGCEIEGNSRNFAGQLLL